MPKPSASYRYLSSLIATLVETGDVEGLQATEHAFRNAGDLTSAERGELRSRIWAPVANLTALGNLAVPELVAMCSAGDRDTCLELDHRGIEPPTIEPGPDPVISVAA
jgi:hypothetical protein